MNSMTRSRAVKRHLPVLAVAIFFSMSLSAAAAEPPSSTATQVSAAQSDSTESTSYDLQQLIDAHQLVELRNTHNGTYGTSLLFQADKLSYYVALFHDKTFWRVIRTDSVKDAESIYRTFVAQTEKLAEVDIDTIRLQAGKKYADLMVSMNEQRLHQLQKDLTRQQRQGQQVAALQEHGRQQAVSLSTDLRATSSQLETVQQNIRQLQAQQENPALTLPGTAMASSPGAQSASETPASTSSSY
ncbi:MAG TPA: DUF2968 domain-containing protein [Rhodanobacter sp.]|nr:DUF2968 domain-containing protein [Rhodanobacter sp.]